jgi:two-component system, NarL family, sensor histidine kinase DesK
MANPVDNWILDYSNCDKRGWRKWFSWDHTAWLVFLGFWFLEPFYAHWPLRDWIWLLLALSTFVPCYLAAFAAPVRNRWIGVVGMLLVALVYVPMNQTSWGTYTYLAAALPEISESTNKVITLLLILCAIILGQGMLFHLHAWEWALAIPTVLLVGMNRLRMEQKYRSDAKLRMAQEEIEQLAKTAERERIARDMHDVLGHSLSLIVLKSELAGRLMATELGRAALEVAEIESTARQALAEVRKTISGYRSEGFASELSRAAMVLETAGVRLNRPAKPPALAPRHDATLSLVLREAVTNIVRHANASECSIELSTQENTTQLVIADDGKGGIREEGSGLRGMRERVQEIGGRLLLDSQHGTRLQIELPQ